MTPTSLYLGSIAQRLAWRLCNPHAAWLIEYQRDGGRFSVVCNGPYHMARVRARELGGSVVGIVVSQIEDDTLHK